MLQTLLEVAVFLLPTTILVWLAIRSLTEMKQFIKDMDKWEWIAFSVVATTIPLCLVGAFHS